MPASSPRSTIKVTISRQNSITASSKSAIHSRISSNNLPMSPIIQKSADVETNSRQLVLPLSKQALHIFFLCNTIIGTSLLSAPYLYASTGIVLSTLLVALSAVATLFTIQKLIECTEALFYSKAYYASSPSFNSIASAAFPARFGSSSSLVCDLASCLYGIGNAASCLIVGA